MNKELLEAVRDFFASEVASAPITKLSLEDQAVVLTVLRFLTKQIDIREKDLRAKLLKEIDALGSPKELKDEGIHTIEVTKELQLGEIEVMRQVNIDTEPIKDPFRLLLKKNKIPLSEVYDTVSMSRFNPSKLASLIDTGRLNQEEVDKTLKVTYTLRTTPSAKMKERLDSLLEGDVMFGLGSESWSMSHKEVVRKKKHKK